jgi:hypothetical protein
LKVRSIRDWVPARRLFLSRRFTTGAPLLFHHHGYAAISHNLYDRVGYGPSDDVAAKALQGALSRAIEQAEIELAAL